MLVIDDMLAARNAMREIAMQAGCLSVDTASSYHDAINKIKTNKPYQIVVCDYMLGNGRDGQQLFEEVTHDRLISPAVIWVMATAEAGYERVAAVADLAPDDYLLKPFTSTNLSERVGRAAARKAVLAKLIHFRADGLHTKALMETQRLLSLPEASRHRAEVMRAQIEILLDMGQPALAEQILAQIASGSPAPWIVTAQARVAAAKLDHDTAKGLLEKVTASHPMFFAAHELKADLHAQLGEHKEAQQAIEVAVARNPMNWRRQRKLSEVAHRNGDIATAARAATAFARHALPSAIRGHDHLHLARVHQAAGNHEAAKASLAKVGKGGEAWPDEIAAAVALEVIANPKNTKGFTEAREIIESITEPSEELGLEVVQAALLAGDNALAGTFAERLLSNRATMKSFTVLRALFVEKGLETTLKSAQQRAALRLVSSRSGIDK